MLSDLRIRVERLIRGDVRNEDISRLLLDLRDLSGGRDTVREMGDFEAHRRERNKGVVTATVSDFFTQFQFHLSYTLADRPVIIDDLPSDIATVLRVTFSKLNDDILKERTGLERAVVKKRLDSLCERIAKGSDGRFFIEARTQEDAELLKCLTGYLIVQPAFDEARLFDEFVDTLISNNLLKNGERSSLASTKSVLALYAVACMHRCVIVLKDGKQAKLEAFIDSSFGKIQVGAVGSFFSKKHGKNASIKFPVYETEQLAANCCDDELRQAPQWSETHLESTPGGRLIKLA